MKVNLFAPLLDMKGKPVFNGANPVNLKDICSDALGNHAEPGMTGTQKLNNFSLGMKIAAAGSEIELTAEELATIKDVVGKSYSPLVVGRLNELIEG